ncbi:hypothetical protein DFH09DRAFT_1072566 [Mycena vulgaris]|nr:hypothetical protein DFH09DRAFT_1072566 [Mycena vulgaris]
MPWQRGLLWLELALPLGAQALNPKRLIEDQGSAIVQHDVTGPLRGGLPQDEEVVAVAPSQSHPERQTRNPYAARAQYITTSRSKFTASPPSAFGTLKPGHIHLLRRQPYRSQMRAKKVQIEILHVPLTRIGSSLPVMRLMPGSAFLGVGPAAVQLPHPLRHALTLLLRSASTPWISTSLANKSVTLLLNRANGTEKETAQQLDISVSGAGPGPGLSTNAGKSFENDFWPIGLSKIDSSAIPTRRVQNGGADSEDYWSTTSEEVPDCHSQSHQRQVRASL